MRRCFIGLRVDERARASARELTSDLLAQRSAARKLRVVPPENLHATIKFLGPTTEEDLTRLPSALTLAAEAARPAFARNHIALTHVNAFKSAKTPRTIFLSSSDVQALVRLASLVDELTCEIGYPKERRATVPHVTIARVEGAKPSGPITQWLEEVPKRSYGDITCDRLVLFESHTGGAHSRYESILEVPLA